MITLSNYLLPMNIQQEVTIAKEGEIMYEGKLGDWNIAMEELRNLKVYSVCTGIGRVDAEIIIDTKTVCK